MWVSGEDDRARSKNSPQYRVVETAEFNDALEQIGDRRAKVPLTY